MKDLIKNVISALATVSLLASVSAAQVNGEKPTSLIAEPRALEDENELKPHLGFILGVSNPEGSYSSGSEIGLSIGYQFYIPYSLVFELSTNGNEAGGDNAELRRTKAVAQLSYNFAGNIPVLSKSYVGLGIGPMVESLRGDDNLELAVMPIVGFDIPLGGRPADNNFSLGANARYLVSSSGLPNVFSANFAAKYWF
jgi:hypothetical protein